MTFDPFRTRVRSTVFLMINFDLDFISLFSRKASRFVECFITIKGAYWLKLAVGGAPEVSIQNLQMHERNVHAVGIYVLNFNLQWTKSHFKTCDQFI
jgi:hypothetical protein